MNFIDAAIAILTDSRKAVTADVLVDQAIEQNLLDRPGRDPLRSMKARLTAELNKGDESRLQRVGTDRWRLTRDAAAAAKEEARQRKKASKKAAAKKKKKVGAAAMEEVTETGRGKSSRDGKAASKKKTAAKPTASKKAKAQKKASTTKAKGSKSSRAAARKEEPPESDLPIEEVLEQAEVDEREGPVEPTAKERDRHTGPSSGRRRKRRNRRRGASFRDAGEAAEAGDIDSDVAAAAPAQDLDSDADTEVAHGAAASTEPAEVVETDAAEREAGAAEATGVEEDEETQGAEDGDGEGEAEIAAIYGDELSGTEPGAAFAEYRDAQTDDEDRPMMPELVANRRDRQRRERRSRRERRPRRGAVHGLGETRDSDRSSSVRGDEAASAGPKAVPTARPAESTPEGEVAAQRGRDLHDTNTRQGAGLAVYYRAGNPLGDAVFKHLSGDEDGGAMDVRELAEVLCDRGVFADDADAVWPHLKAALLDDEQSYIDRGLRPRLMYQGGNQFSIGPIPESEEVKALEASLQSAVDSLAVATHRSLVDRLSNLSSQALEQVAQVYLLRNGWQNIHWIKQVQRSSYALADAPAARGTMLVGVRSGNQPVDRRGVGELRAGVMAKNLIAGLLLAPQPLSEVARHELARSGRSVEVLAGDNFVSALAQCGIGVKSRAVPALYFDDGFFDEIDDA